MSSVPAVSALLPAVAGRLLCAAVLAATAACSGPGSGQAVYKNEQFAASSDYSHRYAAPPVATCEAARGARCSARVT